MKRYNICKRNYYTTYNYIQPIYASDDKIAIQTFKGLELSKKWIYELENDIGNIIIVRDLRREH